VAYFVKGVLDRGIPCIPESMLRNSIGDGSRIVGVRAVKNGKDVFVKANRGVVYRGQQL